MDTEGSRQFWQQFVCSASIGSVAGAVGSDSQGTAESRQRSLDEVVDSLRQQLLDGELAPGQRLVESDLCEQFGCSRFIARVALQELASDGLVEFQRNKGARVRVVSLSEAVEITEVRMVLEGFAASRAAERVTAAGAAELRVIVALMRRAVESGELLTYSELNSRLHSLIRTIAGNTSCSRTIERLRSQVVRHQFRLSLQPGRASVSLAQHEQIVASIVARDSEGAEQAMRHHLSSVLEALQSLPNTRKF